MRVLPRPTNRKEFKGTEGTIMFTDIWWITFAIIIAVIGSLYMGHCIIGDYVRHLRYIKYLEKLRAEE